MKPITQLGKLMLIALLVSITSLYAYYLSRHLYYQSDFRSFYTAAQIAIAEPHHLYNFSTQQQYQVKIIPTSQLHTTSTQVVPFLNPPIFLIPFLLITLLPPHTAYYLILLALVTILIICLYLLQKLFPQPRTNLLALAVLSFGPVYASLFQTQSSLLSLLIFILIYHQLRQQNWFTVGALTGLLAYKPQLSLMLLLYLIVQRQPRALLGAAITGLAGILISLLISPNYLVSLPSAIIESLALDGVAPTHRITWLGLFVQLDQAGLPIPVNLLTIIFSLATAIISFKHLQKTPLNTQTLPGIFTLIIITTLLSVIHAHYQATVLLVIPTYYFSKQYPSPKLYFLIGLGWLIYLLAIFTPTYPHPLPYLPTLYLVSIFIITIIYLTRLAKNQVHTNPH